MTLDHEAEFFDRFQATHDDYDVLGERAYARLLSEFERRLRPVPGETCIDLGCGTGAFTRRLRPYSLRLLGIDVSHRSIKRANQEATDDAYIVGDILRTPLGNARCDIVVFSGVLHHLPTRDLRIGALREARRLLRSGGRLFSFDPSASSPSMWLYRNPRSPMYSPHGKTDNEILIDRRELITDMQDAGFTAVRATGVGGITYRYIEGRIARHLLPAYNLYELALQASPFEDRWGTFVIGTGQAP